MTCTSARGKKTVHRTFMWAVNLAQVPPRCSTHPGPVKATGTGCTAIYYAIRIQTG